MIKRNSQVTDQCRFYGGHNPFDLVGRFGSPLYVYNEGLLRRKMREIKGFCPYPLVQINYSVKANSNLSLLRIVREEALFCDAMSPGEIEFILSAGFSPVQIFYVSNNVSADELAYAVSLGILTSVDSLSQLKLFGNNHPGERVAVRFNPGLGVGHSEKVVTGGSETKFGVNPEYIPQVKAIAAKHGLRICCVNHHMGSLFMDGEDYIKGAGYLLDIARQFPDIETIDIGGGFGVPYDKQGGEKRLDMAALGKRLDGFFEKFSKDYGKRITFCIEPGRYVTAECGVLLGGVYAVKNNGPKKYIGTDLGFSVLARPVMYDSKHNIEVYRPGRMGEQRVSATSPGAVPSGEAQTVTIVGNICESGDYIRRDISLPPIEEGDIIGVLDAGAYGHAMSSNYNNRLRPAEVLIDKGGNARLIRRRDTIDDLMRPFVEAAEQ